MDWLSIPLLQRALVEVVLLSFGAGLLGTFVVLRGLAFYSHALGTATFPGLVLADGVGFGASLGAGLAAGGFALAVGRQLWPDGRDESHIGLVLTAALALGIVLASDVFSSGANVERLLFGSLLAVGDTDLLLAATASALVGLSTLALGRGWVARGFDPQAPAGPSGRADAALLALVGVMTISMLAALGALLATALLVVPAASARLWTDRLGSWQVAAVGLAAVEGVAGLVIAVVFNLPPGASIAALAGAGFALSAIGRALCDRRRRPLTAGGLGCLAIAALTACGGEERAQVPPRPQVLATTPVVADIVREVGGDAVAVRSLLSPNSDPHGYEPRPDDVRDAADARVVVRSGGDLDDWIVEMVERSGSRARVVPLIEGLAAPLTGEAHEHEGGGEQTGEATEVDPHWWHDPRNAEGAANRIRDQLIRLDPARRAQFASNAAGFARRVRDLDARIATCMSRVPERNRKLVTDHDAFSYFARRYDIEVVGTVIPARTTQAQPSAGEVQALIEAIRRERVGAIFPEESVNSRVAQTVAQQTGATVEYRLYGDTLGSPGSPGATYLGMLEANANEMARGFSGGVLRCPPAR